MLTHKDKAIIHLLNAAVELCPLPYDNKAAHRLVYDMRKDGCDDRAICRAIAAFIFDGLAYGNWPSAIAKLNRK